MRHAKTTRSRGFTLVEIMIVVAIIALLAVLAMPSFLRARKRSQATLVLNDLRLIDGAIAQYAVENGKAGGADVFVDDWVDYVKGDSRLSETGADVFGNDFNDQNVDILPDVPAATYDGLLGVVDAKFWLPYLREVTPRAKHKTPGRRRHG